MNIEEIFTIITNHAREVIPKLDDYQFKTDDTLKKLGANSIDRSEIVMMTLESLSLDVSLVDLAGASSISELASLLHERL